MADQILDIRIEASKTTVVAQDESQVLYLLVDVKVAENLEFAKSPVNLCLVIDRSTSMTGPRLQSVKEATWAVFNELTTEDLFSLVTFSDRAETIWSSGKPRDRQTLRSGIDRIVASGGTEILQGLQLGVDHLRRATLANFTNNLILLTDGHTYGDNEACLTLAREAADEGINISAFGIGPEWNDRFLDKLVGLSGGETAYFESPSQIQFELHQRIKSLGETFARNLRLIDDFPEEIKLTSAFRVAPVSQPISSNGSELRLGSIRGKVPLSLLLEFTVDAKEPGRIISLPLLLLADISNKMDGQPRVEGRFDLTVSDQEVEANPPPTLVAAVQAWNFHQMNEKAWDDIEAGEFGRAQTRLNLLTSRLIEAGHSGLAEKIQGESGKLSPFTTTSLEDRKKLKFGTRALVAKTVRLPRPTDA